VLRSKPSGRHKSKLLNFLITSDVAIALQILDDVLLSAKDFRDEMARMIEAVPERYGEDGPKELADWDKKIDEMERAIDYLLKKPKEAA
jgi:hypothetical protein